MVKDPYSEVQTDVQQPFLLWNGGREHRNWFPWCDCVHHLPDQHRFSKVQIICLQNSLAFCSRAASVPGYPVRRCCHSPHPLLCSPHREKKAEEKEGEMVAQAPQAASQVRFAVVCLRNRTLKALERKRILGVSCNVMYIGGRKLNKFSLICLLKPCLSVV